jgi:hypothetical protein
MFKIIIISVSNYIKLMNRYGLSYNIDSEINNIQKINILFLILSVSP